MLFERNLYKTYQGKQCIWYAKHAFHTLVLQVLSFYINIWNK